MTMAAIRVPEGERILTEHIRTLTPAATASAIYSYDVVNETVDEKTGGQRYISPFKAIG